MCGALFVLCAAPDAEALTVLKRAASAAAWELVGGATSAEEALAQVREWAPHVLVFDAALGVRLGERARALRPGLRTIAVGEAQADVTVASPEEIRGAITGGRSYN